MCSPTAREARVGGATDGEARRDFLIVELGLDAAFVRSVPENVPMPPPPASATARNDVERGMVSARRETP
jgi:hypothetical protein